MGPLKIQKVVSFSSEDPLFPASNLLGHGKWKCKEEGEKAAWVMFQLEELSTITNIDIGNCGSAFIEVQVGRQGGDLSQMPVLLVASSFMKPNEARVGDSQNRVRMFGPDSLAAEVGKQKWDLVKVVATQPFNKTTRFGLSFISIGGTGSREVTEVKTEKVNKIGAFKLKDDSESDISVGSYFARKKEEPESSSSSHSVAASMRSDTSLADVTLAKVKKEDKKRKFEMSPAAAEEIKRRKVDSPFPSRQSLPGETDVSDSPRLKRRESETARNKPVVPRDPVRNTPGKDATKQKVPEKGETSKQTKRTNKPQKYARFDELLRGVHFTISGFQNPLRGEIRKAGLDLGAKYHGDWNNSCTHLVCAFANTPKFNQVRGKGKIVKKEWLEECHRQRKRLPWRRFCLDKKDKDQDESEEEVWEEEPKDDDDDCDTDEEIERIKAEELAEKKKKEDEKIEKVNENSMEEIKENVEKKESSGVDAYDCDTDEEIEKIKAQELAEKKIKDKTSFEENKENVQKVENSGIGAYDCDTDEEADQDIKSDPETEENPYDVETDVDEDEVARQLPDTSNLSFETLSNHFEGHQFFFHGSFEEDEMDLIQRYVISSGGKVRPYMDPEVDIIITKVKNEKQFGDAKKVNQDVKFVEPKWIFICHDEQKLVSTEKYEL